MKKWLIGLVMVALAVVAPAAARAHGGHAHKVMGTIASVDGKKVMVKTVDDRTVMVMLDAKTKITQGKTKLEASALKVGYRVVAEGPEGKDMMSATTLKVGEVAPVATKK